MRVGRSNPKQKSPDHLCGLSNFNARIIARRHTCPTDNHVPITRQQKVVSWPKSPNEKSLARAENCSRQACEFDGIYLILRVLQKLQIVQQMAGDKEILSNVFFRLLP